MEEFNFEQLKNIEVPKSCIEKALKIPAESKKSASLVRLYRFAAGIAACVVIAAAVTLSLMTGLNKNVDLTNPNPENPSRSDSVYNGTDPSSTDDISSPSILSPLLFGADDQNRTAVTEPAESSANGSGANGTKNPKQKSASTASGNNKAQAPTKSKSDNASTPQKPNDPDNTDPGDTAPDGDEPFTEVNIYTNPDEERTEQPTTLTPFTDPCVDNPTQPNYNDNRTFIFYIVVFNGQAKGDVYCKVEDSSGTVVSSGLAAKNPYGGKMQLSYSVSMIVSAPKQFTVTFYNSNGVIKQGTVTVFNYTDVRLY